MNFKNDIVKLEVQKVIQGKQTIYISKIDYQLLFELSEVDIIRIQDEDQLQNPYKGIQRTLNNQKVEKITNYLKDFNASFPNSIVLNLDKKYLVKQDDNYIEILRSKKTFSILDGQHRLMGLVKSAHSEKFELIISIFVGLSTYEQSEVFVTINTEQTKLNPSLSVLQFSKSELNTPRKFAANIALSFGLDKESAWFKKIKFTGYRDELSYDGLISLKTFYEAILNLIYDDKKFMTVKNQLQKNNDSSQLKIKFDDSKYIFWDLYTRNEHNVIYKILDNYFNSLSSILKLDWNNDNSIIQKSTGFNASMYLFKDIYKLGLSEGTLDINFFNKTLKNLVELDGKINANNFSASGEQSSRELYKILLNRVNLETTKR